MGDKLIIIIIIISCVLLCAVAGIILAIGIKNYKKNKANVIKVDDEFINNLIDYYGGIKNISNVEVENARLKVEVLDLDLVNLDNIKANSNAGVFVTGKTIKSLYKIDSDLIKKLIDKKR